MMDRVGGEGGEVVATEAFGREHMGGSEGALGPEV